MNLHCSFDINISMNALSYLNDNYDDKASQHFNVLGFHLGCGTTGLAVIIFFHF